MSKLIKVKVSRGIYWIQAPEANLRVLCGCPSDAVKHLMKRGLIHTREEGGVSFETGPNAILLSDVLVQRGAFSNLAEFPVLQMLYRQGMLLPHHPNNTGEKPILIGSEAQVQAQMEYIYRGNYGLISEEELMAAGESEEDAAWQMRMKLKFAFGQIKKTEELLDSRIVENEPVEIMGGVMIRRLALNVFEFEYGGESVTVDLNLVPGERYEAPYPLNFFNISREYFEVIHSGEGDGWDVNRPTMASIIVFQGRIYLIDAGPNLLHSLNALGIGIAEIEGVFHTHCHDDHFCGLATLMRSDHRIKYYATPLVRASVMSKLSALVGRGADEFDRFFRFRDLKPGEWNDIGSLEVKPVFSPHPVETTIMHFRAMGLSGYKSFAHYADIVSMRVLESFVTEDEEAPGITREMYDEVREQYLEPADLKKIDIGGGLIHGDAEDFVDDASGDIFLAHTALELTVRQKEIGSGAPFGMTDVLIAGSQDYVRMYAFEFLRSIFPTVNVDQIRMLLNSPMGTFNPQSLLLKKGEVPQDVHLILTGNVELLDAEAGVANSLSAGGFVGEIYGLVMSPSLETYRAKNFVRTLRIPVSMYVEFVSRNLLYARIEKLQDRREFLQKTWLLGEGLSNPVQNKVAEAMTLRSFNEGQEVRPADGENALFMLKSGQAESYLGETRLETMCPGDFFGEGMLLFGTPGVEKVRVNQNTEMYVIPADALEDIPVVMWKLYETYERRVELLLNPELAGTSFFRWRKEYAIGVRQMDKQHQELFRRAEILDQALATGREKDLVGDTLRFLTDYTRTHFADEEALLAQYDYPETRAQKKMHRKFVADLEMYVDRLNQGEFPKGTEFLQFVKDWLVNHILTHDVEYGRYFKKRGIQA